MMSSLVAWIFPILRSDINAFGGQNMYASNGRLEGQKQFSLAARSILLRVPTQRKRVPKPFEMIVFRHNLKCLV